MLRAIRRGLEARASLGVVGTATPADVDRAIRAAGLECWEHAPLVDRVYGVLHEGVIYVQHGLLPETRTLVKAHELAHHLCGHDAGLYRAPLLAGEPVVSLPEIQAQLAAFAFVVGEPAPTLAGLDAQVEEACNAGGVPWTFLCSALTLLTYQHPSVVGFPLLG